jgi:hypothetical protein
MGPSSGKVIRGETVRELTSGGIAWLEAGGVASDECGAAAQAACQAPLCAHTHRANKIYVTLLLIDTISFSNFHALYTE